MEVLLLVVIASAVFYFVYKRRQYKESSYYQVTRNPYLSLDIGRHGEYLIYKRLRLFETGGAKFLFNLYIPKNNNQTTEIDVLLICPNGLFVFESKNYGGWIFGNEVNKTWTQTFPAGRGNSHKEHFYNPIMQNASHIKYLKRLVGENVPIQSVIVFSDRCTLKNITVKTNNVSVINCRNILPVVAELCRQTPGYFLTETEIVELYDKLFPYSQVDYEIKEQHTKNMQK